MVNRKRTFPRLNISFREKPDGTFDVGALGVHIRDVAEAAADLAEEKGKPIRFEFNRIMLVVTAEDQPDDVVARFEAECDRQAKAYRESPEGRAAAEKRAREIVEKQAQHDELIRRLSQLAPGDHAAALRWAVEFEAASGDIGVHIDRQSVIEGMERLGYKANDLTFSGSASDAEKARIRNMLETDPVASARYIMGQVIACANMGMPPHPVINSFVEKHFSHFGG